MKNRYLIVIDMQNDFIDGALGSPEARGIVENVCEKIKAFEGRVIFTQDTHDENYLHSQEGRLLPIPHCKKNSKGWRLHEKLEEIRFSRNFPVYEKTQFSSLSLARDLAKENEKQPIESIELIGICTDICVVSNALLLKAFLPETPISVDASCCAGVSPKSHLHALDTMRACQIKIG